MNPDDLDGPEDLDDFEDLDDPDDPAQRISLPEERERLLAEAMAHAETQEAHYKVLPADEPIHGRWKKPLAFLVLVLAGVSAAFPPAWIGGAPLPSIQEDDLERGLVAAVYLQALQVEAFRLHNGRLPDDLAEVPAHLPGLRFVKSNNRVYQILGRRPDGEVLIYDSAQPAPDFAAAASAWWTVEWP